MSEAFDVAGKRIHQIMQSKDIVWMSPPEPSWKISPPTFVRWIVRGGFRVRDYDERFIELVRAFIAAYPGSYLTCEREPAGWEPAVLKSPGWTEPESGTYIRRLGEREQRAWKVPAEIDEHELTRFLAPGGWAMWKPSEKERGGMPRILAQDTCKTVRESGWYYLLASSWDNQFTEMSLNPELAGAADAAA